MQIDFKSPFSISKWVLYNSIGWLISITLILGLGAISELAGVSIGGQLVIGLGIGIGMGLMQWLYLRKNFKISSKWLLFSIIGFTAAFVLLDIISYLFKVRPDVLVILITPFATYITSYLQSKYCLADYKNNNTHIYYSLAAWLIAAIITFMLFSINLQLPRAIAIVSAFAAVLIGGPIVGLISGRGLNKILIAAK